MFTSAENDYFPGQIYILHGPENKLGVYATIYTWNYTENWIKVGKLLIIVNNKQNKRIFFVSFNRAHQISQPSRRLSLGSCLVTNRVPPIR